MKYNHYLAVLLAGSLAACGGGSGTTTSPTAEALASSTIAASSASSIAVLQKTTLAQGMVTGFGSVIVNGVHYDVEDADIDVDGESQVESELGIGQMVRITAKLDADGIRGKASKLEGESQVRGAIESIDVAAGVVVAVGQTIIINAETFYQEGITAETLKVGDLIKVSAYTNADGELVATRIALKNDSAADVAQLAGKIADLDTTALTFTLNGTTVNYSKATVGDDITLANDMLVRVRGSLVEGVFVATGTVQASPFNIKHDHQIGAQDGLFVGGLISNLVANTSFKLNDATVLLSAETLYEGGTGADLKEGLLVKVQGALDADNNLVAAKIKLILQPRVNENGLVQSVDQALNTLTVNDVTFQVTVDTSFNDSGKDKVRLFSLADLAVGNTINVQGYKVAATDTVPEHMVATRVERRFPSSNSAERFKVEVHGLVESVTDTTLKVAGRSVTLTEDTLIIGFASLEEFLAAALGTDIEVKGVIDKGVFVATSVEPADEDSDRGQHHYRSSHSAASSTSAGDFPGHSRSSRAADEQPSSEGAHSFSSRSAINPRSARSESSRSAQPSSEGAPSFSSRSAINPRSAHSESSRSAQPSSEGAPAFSSRSAINPRSANSVSSKSAQPSSEGAPAFSSRAARSQNSESSRAPRSAPANASSTAASSAAATE